MEETGLFDFCQDRHNHTQARQEALGGMPPETELAELAELFKVFGDSTRIRILYILAKSELCVCDIAEVLGLTQPAASYQLKALKQARLVKSRREGKTVFYSLADRHVELIIGLAREHLEERLEERT